MTGGIEETSASCEARSAPRSYPTPSGHERQGRRQDAFGNATHRSLGFKRAHAGERAGGYGYEERARCSTTRLPEVAGGRANRIEYGGCRRITRSATLAWNRFPAPRWCW